jgi:hypothetical protein
MTNIKIRAYHKILKRVRMVSKIDLIAGRVWILNPRGEEVGKPWVFEDVILSQYIGIKAMDGREIYDGDVVIAILEEQEGYSRKSQHLVKWYGELGYPGFDYSPPLKKSNVNGFAVTDKLAIIGNRFENPELIPAGAEVEG